MSKVTFDEEVIAKWTQQIVKAEVERDAALRRARPIRVDLLDTGYINIQVTANVSLSEELIESILENLGEQLLMSSIMESLAGSIMAQVLPKIKSFKRRIK